MARSWNSPVASSYSKMEPPSAAASRLACETTVWRTVSTSSVALTARLISPSAVSSWTERESSRVRASSSWNSRTFSMAMTAWSANVWTRAICLSENGSTTRRATVMVPMGRPSRSIGTAMTVRNTVRRALASLGIGAHVGNLDDRGSRIARAETLARPGGWGKASRAASISSGVRPCCASK